MSEGLNRSLVKSISFRILIITSDLVIIYLLTRRLDLTIGLTILRNSASTVFYFIHERLWNKVNWGKRGKILPVPQSA